MKKQGFNVPEYLCIQGHIHHINRPAIKKLTENPMMGAIMTQYHISKGLKVFGKDGLATIDKKLHELVMCDVMTPLDPDKMRRKEKQAALKYLMILTKNDVGKLKVGSAQMEGSSNQILTVMMQAPQHYQRQH
eukprot:12415252-Ditylum_brightwellii.AAC.1